MKVAKRTRNPAPLPRSPLHRAVCFGLLGLLASLGPTGRGQSLGRAQDVGRAQERTAPSLGVAVYKAQRCGVCHRFERAGASGAFAPPHDDMARVARARLRDPAYRGSATTAAGYLRESIVAPGAYLAPGYGASRMQMPAYDALDEDEIRALVTLLLATPVDRRR